MDAGSVKGAAFTAFDTTDGRGNRVRITNLRDLRKLEKESEQQYRNGEGQPMVFRRWAQDDSNRDVHTLGDPSGPSQAPDPAAVRKFGGATRSTTEPDAPFGPGVNESNTSALVGGT